MDADKDRVDSSSDAETIGSPSHSGSGSPSPDHWAVGSPGLASALPHHTDPARSAVDPGARVAPSAQPVLLMPQALQDQVEQLLREQFIYPQVRDIFKGSFKVSSFSTLKY